MILESGNRNENRLSEYLQRGGLSVSGTSGRASVYVLIEKRSDAGRFPPKSVCQSIQTLRDRLEKGAPITRKNSALGNHPHRERAHQRSGGGEGDGGMVPRADMKKGLVSFAGGKGRGMR